MNWKDVTTYSRDDKDKCPHWWRAEIDHFHLSVGDRHIYYPKGDTWLLNCSPWYNAYPLKAKSFEDAKAEAISLVKERIKKILDALEA